LEPLCRITTPYHFARDENRARPSVNEPFVWKVQWRVAMKYASIALMLLAAVFATPDRSKAALTCTECPCGINPHTGQCPCARRCGGGPLPKSVPIRNRQQCSTKSLILRCDTGRLTNSPCSLRCIRKK